MSATLTPDWEERLDRARPALDELTAPIADQRWDLVECSLEGLYETLDLIDWSGRSPWSGPPPHSVTEAA